MSIWTEEGKVDFPRMRQDRVEKAREQMKKDGIGAYLCFDPDNIKYLTDTYTELLVTTMFARNVLFPRTGDPILYEWGFRWQRVRDELSPWLKGNVKPGWRLGFFMRSGLYPEAFINDLKKVLSEHDILDEPLAIDMPIVSLDFGEMLRKAGLNVVDGFESLFRARMVKTQDEIECWKISISIAEEIFDAIRQAIRPGVREIDLGGIAADLCWKRGCDGPVASLVCSGENTNPNMMVGHDRRIRPGEMIFVDLPGVRWKGYNTCVYRCFTCGRATQRQKELYAETLDLIRKGMKQIKPGNTTADICKAWPGPEHWGGKNWRDVSDVAIGHGLGLGQQENPVITPLFSFEHPVKLEENMCLALETFYGSGPGEKPKQGCRIEEMILVTNDGCEILSKWPVEEITEAWI